MLRTRMKTYGQRVEFLSSTVCWTYGWKKPFYRFISSNSCSPAIRSGALKEWDPNTIRTRGWSPIGPLDLLHCSRDPGEMLLGSDCDEQESRSCARSRRRFRMIFFWIFPPDTDVHSDLSSGIERVRLCCRGRIRRTLTGWYSGWLHRACPRK